MPLQNLQRARNSKGRTKKLKYRIIERFSSVKQTEVSNYQILKFQISKC